MTKRTEHILLTSILIIFVVLGGVYSVVVPPFEASDEKWHYPMVKHIADHGSLPVQVPGVETAWRQEGSQPPLYYALMAGATFWIDTSDMDAVRHLNPHADNGTTPDGNVNLAVHNPELEAFPWEGTVLAVHLVRFLSVLIAATGVYLTYRIVREVLPEAPALALGAAAIHAFTPMFIFISASVNNDNLVIPLANLALLMLLRLSRWADANPPPREETVQYVALGTVLGLAALTKTSSLALTLLTAVVVTVRAVRRKSWAEFFRGGLATLLPVLAVSGWWFVRNLRLYGDLTGLSVFTEILGTRDVPADVAQLWRERFSFLAGYWGNFGGLNVPMAAWTYPVLNSLLVIAGVGIGIQGVRQWRSPESSRNIRPFLFLLLILWGLGVFLPWIGWARVTWSSQGRLIFPAIAVWSLLLALGLDGWLPRPWGRWAVGAFATFLLTLSIAAPIVWIPPVYATPEPLSDQAVAAIEQPVDVRFDQAMRLIGVEVEQEAVQPGDQVDVTLYWEALAATNKDYTVFVHLLGEGELLVAQRDTYPGLGTLSTTWLEPGFRWADHYVLEIPPSAFAPNVTQLAIGLYHAPTDQRLPAYAADGSPLGDNARFGGVRIEPRDAEVPNPVSINFGERMELIGYNLDTRIVQPGNSVSLTLYWRRLREMSTNYTVSAQLVNDEQVKAAQDDAWPAGGGAPTAAWPAEETIEDEHTLSVSPDATPGIYNVLIAVYAFDEEEGQIVHLPVMRGHDMPTDNEVLTRVRVE